MLGLENPPDTLVTGRGHVASGLVPRNAFATGHVCLTQQKMRLGQRTRDTRRRARIGLVRGYAAGLTLCRVAYRRQHILAIPCCTPPARRRWRLTHPFTIPDPYRDVTLGGLSLAHLGVD